MFGEECKESEVDVADESIDFEYETPLINQLEKLENFSASLLTDRD